MRLTPFTHNGCSINIQGKHRVVYFHLHKYYDRQPINDPNYHMRYMEKPEDKDYFLRNEYNDKVYLLSFFWYLFSDHFVQNDETLTEYLKLLHQTIGKPIERHIQEFEKRDMLSIGDFYMPRKAPIDIDRIKAIETMFSLEKSIDCVSNRSFFVLIDQYINDYKKNLIFKINENDLRFIFPIWEHELHESLWIVLTDRYRAETLPYRIDFDSQDTIDTVQNFYRLGERLFPSII